MAVMGYGVRRLLADPDTARLYRWHSIMMPRRGHAFGRALHRARRKMLSPAPGGPDGR